MPYLKEFSLSVGQAFETWRNINEFVLKNYTIDDNWLFINYNDLFTPQSLNKIERFTGVRIDKDFPDINLYRSKSEFTPDPDTNNVYKKLLELTI